MAHSYTPGLRVAEATVITKERRLPLRGKVMVSVGQHLSAEDVVARTALPGNVTPLNAANILGVAAQDVVDALLVKPGSEVEKGQTIAMAKSFFGLFKSALKSPITGVLESVSNVTGQIIFRDPPVPVEVDAYVDGRVTEVFPEEGIEIQARGAFIQGIFGVGGETYGTIRMVCSSPDEILDAGKIPASASQQILVGGSLVTLEAVQKAIESGAAAIVAGGFHSLSLRKLLGYELGVAITGGEQIGLTMILTEGFGEIAMAKRTFDVLRRHDGHMASCSGATQIRAGVMRPEIIIARKDVTHHVPHDYEGMGLELGASVRIIREPHFGEIGKVTGLPPELTALETEAKVRVLEVELESGERVVLPRANIEMIEG
jgi:hypothetical protein